MLQGILADEQKHENNHVLDVKKLQRLSLFKS